jgi:predicted transcriptional regulator
VNEILAQPATRKQEDDPKITLELLNAIEADSQVTQRRVANDLGIALGLANAYLKRCVHKGLVKVTQIPANRYAYYLTPRGFVEKSRLTAQYLSTSFNFFRGARDQCAALLHECEVRGWNRVVLAGMSELAEITVLCSSETRAKVIGIVDPASAPTTFAGRTVVPSLKEAGPFDAVIVTDFRDPQAAYDLLVAALPAERVLTPPLLNVSRTAPVFVE